MIIATFGPSTGWAGKTITREGDAFILEGHGPISAADIMEYDRHGQLVWTNDGTRAWVGAKARSTNRMQADADGSTAASAMSKATTVPATTTPPNRGPVLSRRLLVAVGSALAIVIVVVAALVYGGVFEGGGGLPPTLGWTTQDSGSLAFLSGVAFTDNTHGWSVGYDKLTETGTMLWTRDGGLTWSGQYLPSGAPLLAVAFLDRTRGWAVGGGATILATADGGSTWTVQNSGPRWALQDVTFVDADHGWVVGGDVHSEAAVILATTDGGRTWSRQNVEGYGWLRGVAFTDVSHGWAVGQPNTILVTENGGLTWSSQTHPRSDMSLFAVDFADATHGWVVGENGVILATSDGGRTWTEQDSGGHSYLTSVIFTDAASGWVVGQSGAILTTRDGGKRWSTPSWSGSAYLWGVSFPDATHGWAVGEDGTILATTSGSQGHAAPEPVAALPDTPAPATSVPAKQSDSWPTKLAGTWMSSGGTEPAMITIAESGGRATLTRTAIDGRTSSWIFTGGTLTNGGSDPVPGDYIRRGGELMGPFTGLYVLTDATGTMTIRVTFTNDTLTMAATTYSGQSITETFSVSPDGQTLTHYDSGRAVSLGFTRQ